MWQSNLRKGNCGILKSASTCSGGVGRFRYSIVVHDLRTMNHIRNGEKGGCQFLSRSKQMKAAVTV